MPKNGRAYCRCKEVGKVALMAKTNSFLKKTFSRGAISLQSPEVEKGRLEKKIKNEE